MSEDPEIPADDAAEERPDTAQTFAAAERRRRAYKPRRHRHRDLTPEEDNRLRQRQVIIKIIPAILAVVGGAVWLVGIRDQDEYQWDRGLIRTGQVFLVFGAGFFAVLLLREWVAKLHAKCREKRALRLSGFGVDNGRQRSQRRRHRSSKPSGVRVR